MTENEISYKTIGAALEVHKNLGVGLLESAYETALVYELQKLGLKVSDYLRDLGIKGYALAKAEKTKAAPSEAVRISDKKLILSIGVNLNQIAKYINSTHQLHPELEKAIQAVNAVFKR